MAKDLKYFMREQKEEIITAPGPASIKDENGLPITLEIKVIPSSEIRRIEGLYRRRSIAFNDKGAPYISDGEVVFQTEKDSARAVRHIIAEALVYPDLKDKALMEYYKCVDITEMPQLVFSKSDEYTHIVRTVFAALGLTTGANDSETLNAAKN